jgi:hypothetical protein
MNEKNMKAKTLNKILFESTAKYFLLSSSAINAQTTKKKEEKLFLWIKKLL